MASEGVGVRTAVRVPVRPAGTAGAAMSPLSHLGASRLGQSSAHKSEETSRNVPLLITVPLGVGLAPGRSGDGDTAPHGTLPHGTGRRKGLSPQSWPRPPGIERPASLPSYVPPATHTGSVQTLWGFLWSQPLEGTPYRRLHAHGCWHAATSGHSPVSPPNSSALKGGQSGKTSCRRRHSSDTQGQEATTWSLGNRGQVPCLH